MTISLIIATYGDQEWADLAMSRAHPSIADQGADEIIVSHREKATIAKARNQAGNRAKGEFLLFLDADDQLGGGYVDAMRTELRAPSTRRHAVPPLLTPAVSYVINGQATVPRFLFRHADLSEDNYLVVGTLVKKSLFQQVGGFGEYPHGWEDWALWAKCWKAGAQIIQVKEAIYFAHVNPDSKHRVAWRDKATQMATHHRIRKELFPEKYE